ncbi:hypothetical protein CC86DRAFT_305264 [Ophiobolus disseminans]|uniref:Uncharacterized protein n=1 Tax=Ophiobolus disseminans TaxID=1469910 RepID=A0A6A6ZH49_9PLEO|nr:hypothetical protein CC86DRAFT_305264 [Ophiobolus disseminans]
MRYDDWDVILFPRDSHVPIQEFKTACYTTQDAKGQQSPTLTCYINSLPPSTPFRISVHSWTTTARPSAIIESRRKPSQKIVYMVQVVVDGTRVFRGFFDVGSKWPQEIAHEKRTIASSEHRTNQQKARLGFPPFHQHTLMQTTWKSRDTSGRINIVLSEQLMPRNSSPGELELGFSNEIVCFSFQHASKVDVLEQAGISWPIRNPLYFRSADEGSSTSSDFTDAHVRAVKTRDVHQDDVHMQSPLSRTSMSTFPNNHKPEPLQRPNSHPPPFPHFAKPPPGARGVGRPGIWDDSLGSFHDSHDNASLDSWSTQRTASNPSADMFMGDGVFTSTHPKPRPPWTKPPMKYQHRAESGWDDQRQRQRKEKDRQVVLTLRDDQFGQIIDAISPPKRQPGLQMNMAPQYNDYIPRPSTAHAYYPPKMGSLPVTGKPSAAALARKSSYPDLNATLRNASNKPSPDKPHASNFHTMPPSMLYHPSASSNKENCPPSQSRMPTPLPHVNGASTPHPFPKLPEWGADTSLRDRDGSSVFSSFNQYKAGGIPAPPRAHGKHGPAHIPSDTGGIRSRKEGLAQNSSNLSEYEVRHDQSLLPPMSPQKLTARNFPNAPTHSTPSMPPKRIPDIVEIIDVDAIDPTLSNDERLDATKLSPFKPNHKAGMSSLDSTARAEQNLYCALGAEFGGFDAHVNDSDMGLEVARALGAPLDLHGGQSLSPIAKEFEPVGKRKRQGTLGGERDRSPLSKKERGGEVDGEEVEDLDMPRMRGD